MDWIEQLKTWVGQTTRAQKEIAASWHERATDADLGPAAVSTTVTNLSKCLSGNKDGISYFFKDRQRAALLFDELGVEDQQWHHVYEEATRVLETGGRAAPRLVVDVSEWGARPDDDYDRRDDRQLFESVREHFIDGGELCPVAIVVDQSQWDSVPRSFDDESDVEVHRADGSSAAKELVERLAGEFALVASPSEFHRKGRWLPLALRDNSLVLGRNDALTIFQSHGRLPEPSIPEHRLSELFAASAGPDEALLRRHAHGAFERWQLRFALTDETLLSEWKLDMKTRTALAATLGVVATSTERERIEHGVQHIQRVLGYEARKADADTLATVRALAHRRVVKDRLLRVGDTLHLLNPTANIEEISSSPLIKIEHIPRKTPAIARLREHVRDWTMDHAQDDAFLEQAMAALDPNGEERDAFLHARACLLHGAYIKPRQVELCAQWRDALAVLLENEPPVCRLRGEGAPFMSRPARAAVSVHGSPKVDPREVCFITDRGAEHSHASLLVVPPCVPSLTWSREVRPTRFAVKSVEQDRYRYRQWDDVIVITAEHSMIEDDDTWLDLLDASSGCGGDHSMAEKAVRRYQHRDYVFELSSLSMQGSKIEVPDELWRRADWHTSIAWLALRRGLAHSRAIALPAEGKHLLELGGGLLAHLAVRRHGDESEEVSASVLAFERDGKLLVDDIMTTHHARTGYTETVVGHPMPRSLRIDGSGWRVDVEFSFSPLAGGYGSSMLGAPISVERETERQE